MKKKYFIFAILFFIVIGNYYRFDYNNNYVAVDGANSISRIIINKKSLQLQVGKTEKLSVNVTPSTASSEVVWVSNNKSVATVSRDGTVSAVGVGRASIIVVSRGNYSVRDICTVVVTGANSSTPPANTVINVSSITLNSTSLNIKKGATGSLRYTVSPSNATNKEVAWTSSNPKVVTVNGSGVLTAVGVGTATITVTSKSNSNISARCQITVIDNVVSKYTIRLNANGGSGSPQSIVCAYGSECTLSTNSFTKKGYSIIGWATSANGERKYSNGSKVKNLATSGTVDLYAVWQINYVRIKYNVNGGTIVNKDRTIKKNNKTYNWTIAKDGTIYNNGKVLATGIKYGNKLGSSGLWNYNGTLRIRKNGFFVDEGQEWCTNPNGGGTCYNQNGSYDVSKFCGGIERNSCEVTLYLKWNNFAGAVNNCSKNGKVVYNSGGIKLKQCVDNYVSGAFQNIGITNNNFYISKLNTTDYKSGVSVNEIQKINRKTGSLVEMTVKYAGHGQSFDVTSDEQLVLNYFSKSSVATNSNRGVGIASVGSINKDTEVVPNKAYAISANSDAISKLNVYSGTNKVKDLASKKMIANNKNYLSSSQIAIDRGGNKILIYDHSNGKAYIYKYSDFISGKLTKIKVIKVSGVGYGQGVEIVGNYIYLLGDNDVSKEKKIFKSKSHFVYKCNISKGSCKKNNYKNSILQESEGIVAHGGKIYIAMKNNKGGKIVLNLYCLEGI